MIPNDVRLRHIFIQVVSNLTIDEIKVESKAILIMYKSKMFWLWGYGNVDNIDGHARMLRLNEFYDFPFISLNDDVCSKHIINWEMLYIGFSYDSGRIIVFCRCNFPKFFFEMNHIKNKSLVLKRMIGKGLNTYFMLK